MEGISMASIKRAGNTAIIVGKNADKLFSQIMNTPAIDFDSEIKKAKKYHVTYSERGIARIFTRKNRNG